MSSKQEGVGDGEPGGRPTGRPTRPTFIGRSVNPSGSSGADVNIPAPVIDEIGGLETGEGGDKVDLVYDRETNCLEIYLPDNTGDD